ncbi:MAG: cytochrome c1 [Gallionella sp.]|nr:cytochrome c1 [Gallionella sp.]
MMNAIKKLGMLALLMSMPMLAAASEAGVHLDKAPVNLGDNASLQRGAKFFAANCLTCHAASYMRYNRLADIGMSEEDIKQLLPEGSKLGSTMQASMDPGSAKLAFGVSPPDLSVIARARGQDWLYTYMRSFYADSKRPSGANNLLFPGVGMPNIFAPFQGERELHVENHEGHETGKLVETTPGSMKPAEFDATIVDVTNYLVYMGDPSSLVRHKIGYIVLGFLLFLFILVFALKKEIWKDIH